jgi:hypothetical protein
MRKQKAGRRKGERESGGKRKSGERGKDNYDWVG